MCCLLPPGEGALCSIPIENILAVERLEEESFKMKNVRNTQVSPDWGKKASVQKYSYEDSACSLTSCLSYSRADVPGYSARASTLHPGQQLCRGPRLDRHPDQSQPVQPQTLKHLSSFSLPQWPLALLQALSWHSPWVHALHRVCKHFRMCPALNHVCLLALILPRESVFSGLPANIQLDVDGDRETERIYSLFITYMNKLIKMQGQTHVYGHVWVYFHTFFLFVCLYLVPSCPAEACGSKSVYDGPEQEEYSSFVIDDPQETYKTLKQIVSAVQTLEQQHTKYKRDKFKKTKIGSQ